MQNIFFIEYGHNFCRKKGNQRKYSKVLTILHAKSESPLLRPSKWIYKAKAKHKTSDTNQGHIICELSKQIKFRSQRYTKDVT